MFPPEAPSAPPPWGGATSGPTKSVPRWPTAHACGARPGRAAGRRFSSIAGFTLVELLVALFVLSLVAVMSWRGLDGMVRVQSQTQERADDVLALQIGLAQWKTDLNEMVQLPQWPALDWDGRVLRLTRLDATEPGRGIRVSAWTQRAVDGRPMWLRWQSPLLRTRGEVEDAWRRAEAWSQSAGTDDAARAVAVLPMVEWQLFYHRGGVWTNPQSRDASTTTTTTTTTPAAGTPTPQVQALPDGVRLVLVLPPTHPLGGALTVDWASPTLSAGRAS